MAAYSTPQGTYCSNCGTSMDAGALVCPNCKRFTHGRELDELATRARQLFALGQLEAARQQWLATLNFLPPDSPQRRSVKREIDKIDERLSPKTRDWTKRFGPFGVLIAGILKYKTVALVLLTKGKFLLSILAFLGVYWAMFGWWFAFGLTASVFMHEMGHYLTATRFGFRAELPMFLPGFGAYVKWQGAGVDVNVRAQIALAGPFFGFLSGLMAYGVFLSTGHSVWLAIAQFAGWLNLLNLIPVLIFDGGSAMNALGMQGRLAVVAVCLVMFFLLNEWLFLFVAIGAGYRIWKRDFPPDPQQRIALAFLSLVMMNGFLSWFATNQAHTLFAR